MTEQAGAAAPVSEQAVTAPAATEQASAETIHDLDAVPEVAETVPSEPDAETEAAETEQPEGDEDSTGQPKRLTRNQRLQRKAARLSTMLAEQAIELERLRTSTAKADADSEPKEADYNGDWTKYQADLTAWTAAKTVKAVLDEDKHQQRTDALKEKVREATEDFLERVEEIKPKLPNFDKVLATFEQGGGKFAPHVIEEIRDSEKGPLLAYNLAQNPSLVAELNAMSPRDAAREIGRLEARASLPKPRTQTQAPAPLAPVTGGASASFDPNTSDDMEAYVKWRAKA